MSGPQDCFGSELSPIGGVPIHEQHSPTIENISTGPGSEPMFFLEVDADISVVSPSSNDMQPLYPYNLRQQAGHERLGFHGYSVNQNHQSDYDCHSSRNQQFGGASNSSNQPGSYGDSSATSNSMQAGVQPNTSSQVGGNIGHFPRPQDQVNPGSFEMQWVGAGFVAPDPVDNSLLMVDPYHADGPYPPMTERDFGHGDIQVPSRDNPLSDPWSSLNRRLNDPQPSQYTQGLSGDIRNQMIRSGSINMIPYAQERFIGLDATSEERFQPHNLVVRVEPPPGSMVTNPLEGRPIGMLSQPPNDGWLPQVLTHLPASQREYSEDEQSPYDPRRSELLLYPPGSQGSQSSGATSPSGSTVSGLSTDSLSCPQCDASFHGKHARGSLARHIRGHNKKPIKCEAEGCNKFFERSDARLKHYRKRHPDIRSDAPIRRK
ncbi:hypothetical protein BS50DRAFT_169656 [Corynespora cassiicola Philippines]|uniref:C2H2-type domain-containing protein n=1 Tax=Corynespora cassiicola Philippines TaxID=1448308 RepID=A0A2T2P563_CORCC|nr:hypothetical protein BS50DRAFT_169656 [Corynespora cassiicola Philippines]